MKLTLRDVGYAHMKKIMQGKKWVGRVVRCEGDKAGQYYGKIGKDEAYGTSWESAFRKVAALAMGYESVAALTEHNARVLRERREQRARLAPVREAIRRGDLKGFIDGLDAAVKYDEERFSKGGGK